MPFCICMYFPASALHASRLRQTLADGYRPADIAIPSLTARQSAKINDLKTIIDLNQFECDPQHYCSVPMKILPKTFI